VKTSTHASWSNPYPCPPRESPTPSRASGASCSCCYKTFRPAQGDFALVSCLCRSRDHILSSAGAAPSCQAPSGLDYQDNFPSNGTEAMAKAFVRSYLLESRYLFMPFATSRYCDSPADTRLLTQVLVFNEQKKTKNKKNNKEREREREREREYHPGPVFGACDRWCPKLRSVPV